MSKKYKSYSKEDKLSLLRDYYQSGLSKKSFCKSRGIADTCHYLDLSQQSNTINNKTKKKFPVFAYFLYLCHRIPSIKKTDSNKRR
jgi:transposase-like protein